MGVGGRIRSVITAVAVVLGAAATPASAQEAGENEAPALVDAVMTVDATGDGPVYVELRYRLRPGSSGVVPLEAVLLDGISVAGVSARVWEDPVPVDLPLGAGPAPRGRIVLPPALRAGEVPLLLRYRVEGGLVREGDELRLQVPVLAVGWPPAQALPGTFKGRIHLPGELRITGGFPSGWAVEPTEDGTTVAATDLPVLPALLSVRARTAGTGPAVTLAQGLGALVLLVLAGVAAAGVRHLRGLTP